MRRVLSLILVIAGLPCLVAYAASHRVSPYAPGAGKVSINRARAFLPAPGAPPATLALRLVNSAGAPRYVTRLQVVVGDSPPGCSGSANLRIVQSNVSSRRPLKVPAGGAVRLPAQGITAPTIRLIDRPVSQDGCKRAQFPLRFAFRAMRRRG
jgi:hypothetical protein